MLMATCLITVRSDTTDRTDDLSWGHGYVVRKQSSLTVTNSIWTLTTDIKIALYREIVTKVQNFVHTSTSTMTRDFPLTQNPNVTSVFGREIITRMQYENNHFLAKSKGILQRLNVIDSLISAKHRSWSRRNKRLILAPVMGTALKFLFGTADNNDVLDIHRRIEQLDARQNKIHHINELQATLLQTLHNDNIAQDALLSKITVATNNLGTILAKLQTDIAEKLDRNDHEARIRFNLLTNIEITRDAIDRANNIVQDLLLDVSFIAAGKIPPHLLPPDLLLEGLQAISNVLPHDYSLLSPIASGTLWDYYNVVKVQSIVLNEGLRLFINLPIIVPRSTFDVFNIISFPTQIPDTDNFTVTRITQPFIALSRDHDYYVPLTAEDLHNCHRLPTPTCIQHLPVWTVSDSDVCELSIVLKDQESILHNCNMFIVHSPKPKLLFLYERHWAYFFPRPLTIRFNCQKGTSQPPPLTLCGSGTLVLPLHCSANSKYFFLRAEIRGNSSLESVQPSVLVPTLQNLPLPPVLVRLKNESIFPSQLPIIASSSSNEWQVSITELEASIKSHRPIFKSQEERIDYISGELTYGTGIYSLFSATGLIILFGVVSLLGFLYLRHKRGSAQFNTVLDSRISSLQEDIKNLRSFTLTELECAKTLILRRQEDI